MLDLLRRRPAFARLFAADVVSMLGDWLAYVAVSVLALRSESGVWALALVHVAHTLPQIAAAPLAGWLADRVERRRLAALGSLARGAIAIAMACCAAAGETDAVTILLFARIAGAPFVATPLSAMVPRLVGEGELAAANALRGASWAIVFTAGVALGGVVAALFGPAIALAIDALTFFTAAAILAGLPTDAHPKTDPQPSLAADARAHPERLRLALAKMPAQLASGAAFVALGMLAGGAVGLGALHALRGAGQGAVPWLVHRRIGARAMIAIGTAASAMGAALLALGVESALLLALACVLWGGGSGASWVGATTALQEAAPSGVLGRYTALDVVASSLASALGALGLALLSPLPRVVPALGLGALALFALPRRARALVAAAVILLVPATLHAQWLTDALRERAVTDARFAARDLYTWTTAEQAARIREERVLLVSSAGEGAVRAPYQRALDSIARGEGESAALARALTAHPSLARRRYAWTTPYGTVVPRGGRSYGPVLVHARVREAAWFGRFAPEERQPFSFTDARGRPVPAEAVLAAPERLALVYHVRSTARGGAYRELVLHSEGQLERFAIDTPEVRARVREDLRILRALRGRRWPPRALAPLWRAPANDVRSLFAATMPFDTRRHRPSAETLTALREALAAWRPSGPPFQHPPE